MPNLCQWTIWSVLLGSILTHVSQPTFERKDPDTNEILLCDQCPPGESMATPCTRDKPTVCKPCAMNHFTKYWNYLDMCLYCNAPCNMLEVEVVPCNGTQNRVCECKTGYHAESIFCIKDSMCPPGSGVVEPGTPEKDTECAWCPEGTFSSNFSSEETCKTHRNCARRGFRINVPGNRFHDAYCTSCRPKKGSGRKDCYESALDFVAFQIKDRRKVRRLYRLLNPHGAETNKLRFELQRDLHEYLLRLKDHTGHVHAWNMVEKALTVMKMKKFVEQVRRKFSVG
ncbi:tumor necrosis factor receptor superfamily member 6B-like [Erythrolamprus reginae]|uniref:tumor necrosis factor receptor superfamily member 6B-like n=1 Tax=Erythrolamprus reginae TaxID=121349 RepID=UPI00396C3E21